MTPAPLAPAGAAHRGPLERARNEYAYERTAAWKHRLTCRWCAESPCPMARSNAENVEAHRRHLAMLAADAALAEGIAW